MIRSPLKALLAISLVGLLASCNGSSGSGAALQSIDVTPQAQSAAAGIATQMTATGTYSDGSHLDVTSQVSWSSSNSAVASVSPAGQVSGIVPGSATISAALNGTTGTTTYSVTAAVLVSIEITPPAPSIASGTTVLLTATGLFSDNSSQNLTSQITWSSSSAAVAVTNSSGLAAAAGVGSATITATRGSISGSTILTVTPAVMTSIQVTPAAPSIAKGVTKQFTATGIFSDNSKQNLTSQVTWSSSDTSVTTIGESSGLAVGAGAGTATISAATGGLSGSTALTVTPALVTSIQVTPTSPTLAKGVVKQFTATGLFSDNSIQDLTTQVTWSSTNTASATVSNVAGSAGVVTATGTTGSATITAILGAVSGNTVVTVTPAALTVIQVTPAIPSLPLGLTQQFVATGVYTDNTTQNLTSMVTWTSSATAVATVSNAGGSQGIAAPVSAGTTTIKATLATQSGSTVLTVTAAALVSIQVTPTNPSVAKGLTRQFTATGVYTDNSTQDLTATALWLSSATAVATIDNALGSSGLATTATTGSAVISATVNTVTGTTTLTVTPAALVSIQVTPANPSIAKGLTKQFTATGTYTDNSTQPLTTTVTWSPGTPSVATINNAAGFQGVATAAGVGSTTIIATSGAVSGSTTLTVTPATLVSIQVTPPGPSIAKGKTQQFTATGTYTDGTTQPLTTSVTWSPGTPSVATISNVAGTQGVATATNVGSTSIIATSGAVSGSTTLIVTSAVLMSIAVTPPAPSVANGLTQQFTATGTYSDATTLDLTQGGVLWGSLQMGIATVSNASGSQGLATAVGTGTATITATSGVISGTTTLTVTPATLVSIAVTQPTNPAAPDIALGLTAQFVATGTYTDNTQKVPSGVVWASSDTSVATISATGLATPVAASAPSTTITITATVSGVPPGQAITAVISSFQFGTSVYGVLTNNCMSCHSSGTSPASWTYSGTASATQLSLVSDTYLGNLMVVAGDHSSSSLYFSACTTAPSDPIMPPGTTAGHTGLGAADCATIAEWIDEGANLD